MNTDAHHVVLIAHHAPWLLKFRSSLLKELKASGVRVTVLAPGNYPDLRADLLDMGVDYFSYNMSRTGTNIIQDLNTLTSLVSLLRALSPTHILTTAVKPNIWGAIAARIVGVRHVFVLITGLGYTFTGNTPRQRAVSSVVKLLYKIAFLKVKTVIFQNPDDRSLMIDYRLVPIAKTTIVAGSGVDLVYYAPQPLPPKPPFRYLMVARLIVEKGIREYVDAARYLRRQGLNVEIMLAGPLDENPTALTAVELKDLINEGSITYLGELIDVRPALSQCHVFVLPSYREGTPRSTLEALAVGRPIITTDAPGCRETVQDGVNGMLVRAANSLELAQAMIRMLECDSKLDEMAAASLKLARSKYDVNLVNRNMLNIMGLAKL